MKFDILYVDPPWTYDNPQDNNPARGGISNYTSMTSKALNGLSLSTVCEENSAIYCWATAPKLPEAIEFIESNGFTYVTVAFVWLKLNANSTIEEVYKPNRKMPDITIRGGTRSGQGYYTNSQTEFVLLGRRGKRIRESRCEKQVIMSPVRDHSRKPDEVRTRIDKLVGDRSKLELFARVPHKQHEDWPGWVFAGDQVPDDYLDIIDALDLIRNDKYLT